MHWFREGGTDDERRREGGRERGNAYHGFVRGQQHVDCLEDIDSVEHVE
jgi:hypothetical protein